MSTHPPEEADRLAALEANRLRLESELAQLNRQAEDARRQIHQAEDSAKAGETAPASTGATVAEEDEYGDEYDDGDPPSFRRWLGKSPPWLVSTVLHGVLFIILALMTLAIEEKEPRGVAIVATEVTETALEELTELEIEIEELEVQEVRPDATMPDPGEMSFSDLTSDIELPAATAEVGELALANTTIGEVRNLFGKDGAGMADVGDGLKAAASFFGTKSTGNRFVFVVDNSNSMGRGKFETAVTELIRSVDAMSPKQRFYVIFFSDSAYRLFHPKAAPGMVPATDENKQRLRAWIYSVEMCLRTQGMESMQLALRMNPDVIYILGDGAFTDKTGAMLTAPHNRRTVINTVGMEVGDRGEKELKSIAAANKGTYRLVRSTPQAIAMARQNPIKRNNTRGPVWGLKLPLVKKK